MKTIYLDNGATTPMDSLVFEAMEPYFKEFYANPASSYGLSSGPKKVIRKARENIADFIGASPREIYFTSGGSEANNWAIKGIATAYKNQGNHIITSKIEHHSVLTTCEYLESDGFEVSYLNVDAFGVVDLKQLRKLIRPTTILISIMYANNEIGTIQPVKEIGKIARDNGIFFHSDAVQAYGHIPIDVMDAGIDLLSASGHKIYGPKGSGLLYINTKLDIKPLIHGGSQERGRRAGTLNVPAIVGLSKATELANNSLTERMIKEQELRDYLVSSIVGQIPDTYLNGDRINRLPNNVNLSFKFIQGDSIQLMLDQEGIYVSIGSACDSDEIEYSHVIKALGVSSELAFGTIRMTLGKDTTKEDIDITIEKLKEIVPKLRMMSPLI